MSDELVRDVRRIADRAANAASVYQGIPAFVGLWTVLADIASDLKYAADKEERAEAAQAEA